MQPQTGGTRLWRAVRLEGPVGTPEAQVKWSLRADTALSWEGPEQPGKASWRRWARGGAARPSRPGVGSGVGRGPAEAGSACLAVETLVRGPGPGHRVSWA